MNFLEAIEAMKQGKRVHRMDPFLESRGVVGPSEIYFKHGKAEFNFLTIADVEATDWEIYEEPKKTHKVVRYQWARHEFGKWVVSPNLWTEEEVDPRKWTRLDHTRWEREEIL